MQRVALNGEFEARRSIFDIDGDDGGFGLEINYVRPCLIPSLFAFWTDSLIAESFQFQRELQGLFWNIIASLLY